MGKKRRAVKYSNSIRVDRREWRHSMPQMCMHCDWDEKPKLLEVHEIERRSQAVNRWWHRCQGLLLCHACHSGIYDSMPHARQLAVKYLKDPEHYDLEAWLKIKPRPSTYVTEEEVMREVRDLLS